MLRKLIDRKLLKFLLVGVINTVVGATIMFVLYNIFSCSYWVSTAANYIVGSILSYFLNKYFTFKNKEPNRITLLRFIINIGICYFIAYGIAKPLVPFFIPYASVKIKENMAMIVGMVLFTGLNYIGQRFYAFGDSDY